MDFFLLWLWEMGVLACAFFLISLFFFYDSKNPDNPKTLQKYYRSIAFFMVIFSLNGFLDLYAQYRMLVLNTTDIPDNLRLLSIGKGQMSFLYMITLLQLGFTILSHVIEIYIKQSKHAYLSYILFICFLISLTTFFGPWIPKEYHIYIFYLINATLIPFTIVIIYWGLFYFILALKSAGIVRRKAYYVVVGLGSVMMGIILDSIYRTLVPGEYLIPSLFKIWAICGTILLFLGFKHQEM